MTTLAATPTSVLMAELNARRQRAPVEIMEIRGPRPDLPTKWALYRDGDVYQTGASNVWRQRHIALCASAGEAREIARLINEADAQRALADTQ